MKTINAFSSIESFTTSRLIARKLNLVDFINLTQLHINTEVMSTLGGTRSAQQTQSYIEKNLQHWDQNGFGMWLFFLKENNEFVGYGGLRRVEIEGTDEIEIPYALLPKFWGKNYATEIAQACVEVGFEILRLNNIVCFTLLSNKASQRVMQKAGFQYEFDLIYCDLPHVLYRIKNPRSVEINKYDLKWPELFEQEAILIKNICSDLVKEIYHIGSTAIPGMSAKPVIDMLLVCENVDDIDLISKQLLALGYQYIRRSIIPFRIFFSRKEHSHISFHLHIMERGDPQINRHIHFRDYLIVHPDESEKYKKLKLDLAEKYKNNLLAYVRGKDHLVQEIDAKAKIWNGRKTNFLSPNKGDDFNNWTLEKLEKSFKANFIVFLTHFSQFINQMELIRIPGYTLVNSGIDNENLNSVIDTDFSSKEAKEKIVEIKKYFQIRNIAFTWWNLPFDKPEDLKIKLLSHQFKLKDEYFVMISDLKKANLNLSSHPKIKIKSLKSKAEFINCAKLFKNQFEKYFLSVAEIITEEDPIEYYIAYFDEKPIACSASCYYAQLVGIYDVFHSDNQSAVNVMRIFQMLKAKERGYHVAASITNKALLDGFLEMGFKQFSTFSLYVPC